jgi:hypothetical protein
LKSGKSQKIDLFLFSSVFSSNFHKNQKTDDFQKQKEKADFTLKKKKKTFSGQAGTDASSKFRCRERTKRGISVFEVHQLMTLNFCDFLGVVSGHWVSAEASCSKTGTELLKLFTKRRSSGRIHGSINAMLCEDAISSNCQRSQQPTNSDHTK